MEDSPFSSKVPPPDDDEPESQDTPPRDGYDDQEDTSPQGAGEDTTGPQQVMVGMAPVDEPTTNDTEGAIAAPTSPRATPEPQAVKVGTSRTAEQKTATPQAAGHGATSGTPASDKPRQPEAQKVTYGQRGRWNPPHFQLGLDPQGNSVRPDFRGYAGRHGHEGEGGEGGDSGLSREIHEIHQMVEGLHAGQQKLEEMIQRLGRL